MHLQQPFLSEPVRSSIVNMDSTHSSGQTDLRDVNPAGYENLDYVADMPEFAADHSLHLEESDLHSFHGPLLEGLQTPFATLDELSYRQFAGKGHSHSLSLILNLADPPQIPYSHSSSTFHLVDLMPPLLLLVSNQLLNQLLADSPFSASGTVTTPGRRGMSKAFATPSRVGHSPSVKIGKTPLKGHRRTRSKAVEVGSSNLLATIANMKNKSINHVPYESDTSLLSNPFDSTIISPRVDNLSNYDATPLTTPAKLLVSGSQYFTPANRPISHSNNFGGNLDPSELLNLRPKLRQSFSSSQGPSLVLPRSETLDSINVDEQDDDACKQLKKAKSFTQFCEPLSGPHRVTSMRKLQLEEYLDSSPSKAQETQTRFHPHGSASPVGIMLSDADTLRKKGNLSSYPASIDLASITNLDASNMPSYNSVAGPRGIFPQMATMRSAPVIPLSHSAIPEDSSRSAASTPNLGYSGNTTTSNLRKSKGAKSGTRKLSYPSATEIQEASTTQEIAYFAEKILNSDLKRPIVVQETEKDVVDPKKKHKCPLCFARFQRPEHVKRHLKSHSDEKPFQCDYPDCHRRFNRKDNLKAHLKKIHKQEF